MYRLPVCPCLRPEVHVAPSAQNTNSKSNPNESCVFLLLFFCNDSGFYILKWLSTTTHQSAVTLKPLCYTAGRTQSCSQKSSQQPRWAPLRWCHAGTSCFLQPFVFYGCAAAIASVIYFSCQRFLMLWLTVVCKYYQIMTAVNICIYI